MVGVLACHVWTALEVTVETRGYSKSSVSVMAIYQLQLVINGIIHSINGVISTYN